MTRLYRAWSLLDNFMGKNQVKLNWFVIGRSKPVAPYEKLIDNYDESDEDSGYDRLSADEYFTLAEVEELRNYLFRMHEVEVYTEEVPLPLRSGGLSYELLLISGLNNFYTLADEEGYDLSVAVLGHFDIKDKLLPDSLSPTKLSNGIDFLLKVFDHFDISGIEQNDLAPILNKIHQETGYYIERSSKSKNIKN